MCIRDSLITVKKYLGICSSFEHMSCRKQVPFDFLEIINLPVEQQHFALVLIEYWLPAAFQVDNGKPAKSQGDRTVHIIVGIVGTAVPDSVCHAVKHTLVTLSVTTVDESHKSTHTTVSYTHLDVYKRQRYAYPHTAAEWVHPDPVPRQSNVCCILPGERR